MLRDPSAKRYAQAAFELALERGQLDAWERDMAALASGLAAPEAEAFLASGLVPAQAKEDLIRRLLPDPDPLVWNLVRLLSSKGRLRLLPQVAEYFQTLVDEHRGIAHAEVITAVPVSDDERQALVQKLSELTGKQVTVELHEEPEIIGGLVARIGDQLIDGSTRTKLLALRRRLAGMAR